MSIPDPWQDWNKGHHFQINWKTEPVSREWNPLHSGDDPHPEDKWLKWPALSRVKAILYHCPLECKDCFWDYALGSLNWGKGREEKVMCVWSSAQLLLLSEYLLVQPTEEGPQPYGRYDISPFPPSFLQRSSYWTSNACKVYTKHSNKYMQFVVLLLLFFFFF